MNSAKRRGCGGSGNFSRVIRESGNKWRRAISGGYGGGSVCSGARIGRVKSNGRRLSNGDGVERRAKRTNGLNKRRRRPCLSCDFKRHSRRRALVTIRRLRSPPLHSTQRARARAPAGARVENELKIRIFQFGARCLSASAEELSRSRNFSFGYYRGEYSSAR